MSVKTLIIGGGIFGITAAVELNRRGHEVHLFDQGPLPHPDAASTDINKMIRADYGADAFYTRLMLNAFEGWERWNKAWPRPLFHQTGFLLLTQEAIEVSGFEMDSLNTLRESGIPVERLSPEQIRGRYPQWKPGCYVDGYFNPLGGWAESGTVVAQLVEVARREGVRLHEGESFKYFLENGDSVRGIITVENDVYAADFTIMAAGAWAPEYVPELKGKIWASGHPVYILQPKDAASYRGDRFPGWASDISRTGWYGFPATADGAVKIANHGPGTRVGPLEKREVPEELFPKFQDFLFSHLPGLLEAPVTGTRLCLYTDTWDGDFYICHHPAKQGLVIATGCSGHAFKFAPVLGEIIADVTEGKENAFAHRFRWREKGAEKGEAARYKGDSRQ